MDTNEVENLDSTNEETETVNSINDETNDAEETDKPEYTEREKQYYARIKKLEQELKEAKTTKPETTTANGLSVAETIALSKANVEPDDIEDIIEYAKFKKISVMDALKSPVMKATLAEKAELRKSAAAVSTGGGRRAGSGAISDERLLADAQKGILPENETDMARLQELRFKGRR